LTEGFCCDLLLNEELEYKKEKGIKEGITEKEKISEEPDNKILYETFTDILNQRSKVA